MRSGRQRHVLICMSLGLMLLAQVSTHAIVDVSGLEEAAASAYKSRNYEQAANLYKQARIEICSRPSTPGLQCADAAVLLKIAKCYIKLGSFSTARDWLKQIIDCHGDMESQCADAQYVIAETYAQEGLGVDAEEAWQKLADRYPGQRGSCAHSLLLKGQSQLKRKDYLNAELTFRDLIGNYPERRAVCADAKLSLARSLLEQRKLDEAIAAFSALPAQWQYPPDKMALITVGLALSYEQKDDRVRAKEWFTRAIDYYGNTMRGQQAYFHRAHLLIKEGKYPEAMQDISRITVAYLKEYALGSYHYFQNDWAEAASHYSQVLPNFPDAGSVAEPVNALQRLAFCYVRVGENKKAVDAITQLEAFQASR